MATTTPKPEVDHHILRLIIGIIALMLASVTEWLSPERIASISAAYHQGGMARDIFVGSLIAISAFLFAYNGSSRSERNLGKIAAFAAPGVALFPCGCGGGEEALPYVHYVAAAIMFLVLAGLCLVFFRRARDKRARQAAWRSRVYAVCGAVLILVILILTIDHFTGGRISAVVPRLVFYGERAGLIAFGIAWLVASRTLPVITAPDERIKVLPESIDPA